MKKVSAFLNKMITRKKKYVLSIFFVFMITLALVTNPTSEDYTKFMSDKAGHPFLEERNHVKIRIERINFYVFSTYTPYFYVECGATHIGVFGHFFRISDGQFDYPKWLELFN